MLRQFDIIKVSFVYIATWHDVWLQCLMQLISIIHCSCGEMMGLTVPDILFVFISENFLLLAFL
jgi:hypothetical protein